MAVTIDDIAKKAGVSSATISRVINNSKNVKDKTREKVLKVIEEMNYVPSAIARNLSRSESTTIGIIVPDITNSYFGEIIKGISKIAQANDLNIVLFNTDNESDSELRALNIAKEHRLKGLIMTPGFGQLEWREEFIKTFETLNIPVVLVSSDLKYIKFSGVFVDDVKSSKEATNALIKEGHSKIGIISGLLSSETSIDRIQGYKEALNENNIDVIENFIFNGEFSLEKTYKLTKEILNMKEPPTALVICSNKMTLGVIKAIYESNKKIPDDMAIIGFNNIDIVDVMGINLSYIEDSPIMLGEHAIKILMKILNTDDSNKIIREKLVAQLILKGSEK